MSLQIDHVSITVTSIAEVREFYDAVMMALGVENLSQTDDALKYGARNTASDCCNGYITIVTDQNFTATPHNHWCFRVDSRDIVDEFYLQGIKHGGVDRGQPNVRADYHDSYYASFLLDPVGNKIEVVCHVETD